MKRDRGGRFQFEGRFKYCTRCYSRVNGGKEPANAEKCRACGGRAFFFGAHMPRVLWPSLAEGGPDTYDCEADEEIPGVWDQEMSRRTEPRWRRKE